MSFGDSPGFGCDADPDAGKICDCLGCSLETIAEATEKIAEILDERMGKLCENIDECVDEIIEAINDRISGGLASASQCRLMLQQGLGGTLEYAMKCASVTADECDSLCSPAGPMTNGECCKLADGTEGICVNGICVPKPEEEEEEKKFIGWCNPTTKIVVVTKPGESSPGPGFQNVALAETELVAFNEAQSFCESIKETLEPIERPRPTISGSVLPFCDLTSLLNGQVLNIASGEIREFFQRGGALGVANSFQDIGAFGITVGDVGSFFWGSMRMVTGMPSFMADVAAQDLPGIIGCNNPAFVQSLKLLATAQTYQHQSGVDFSDFLLPYRYAMHAACRQAHLSTAESMRSYLSNGIDFGTLDGLWAIHGMCPEDVAWNIQSEKSKPVPLQLAIMRHRQIIGASEYHNRMREVGYLDQVQREQLFDITRQVPTLSDIIRFMVRDTDDLALVAKFDLNDKFTDKYGDQLKRWAQDQGIPDEVAVHAWRAHWTIPPPTQLFTFWHRLRKNPAFGTEAEQLDEIKTALIQQDILPFWHDKILAVSFRPLRLRDIRRSFQIGTLSVPEVEQAFTDLGFSDPNVALMVSFVKRLRDNAVRNHPIVRQWYRFQKDRPTVIARLTADGIPRVVVDDALTDVEPEFAKSIPARAYIRGDLTKASFESLLSSAGVSAAGIALVLNTTGMQRRTHSALLDYEVGTKTDIDAINDMVNDGIPPSIASTLITESEADIERDFIKRCIAGIKRKYLLGELDDAQAIAELSGRGVTNQRAAKSVDWWACELKSSERNVSANTLCEWLSRGAITAKDFVERIERIGFDPIDASFMLEDCLLKIDAKRVKQAKKEMKEEASERASEERARKRREGEIQRNAARLLRAQAKAARTRIMRMKAQHRIVDKLTDKTDASTESAYIMVESERKRIRNQFALTVDMALQALTLAAEEMPKSTLAEYPAVVSVVAQRIAESDVPPLPGQLASVEGNGQGG